MKKTFIALTTTLLLAGAAASPAFAQNPYYYVEPMHGDVDRDGIPNSSDRFDNRYAYDRHGNRVSRDRDCDGLADRYDRNDRRSARDADCDGVPNRRDRYDNRRYSAPRYIEPRGYRYSRWDEGGYLPRGYYGNPYYIDYRPYGLRAPPYGYRWNRVGNDVYLISTRDGLIAEVIYSLFR